MMSDRDQLLKLKDEFYERLKNACGCSKCTKEFIEWLIPEGNGIDIENSRGEEWDQLCEDYFHIENLYYQVTSEVWVGSGDEWLDLSRTLNDEFGEKTA